MGPKLRRSVNLLDKPDCYEVGEDSAIVETGLVRKPLPSERAHAINDGKEGDTLVGEGVLHARRNLSEALALDDTRFLEPLQSLTQRLGRYAVKGTGEFAESALTLFEIAQDQRSPAVADDFSRFGDRTPDRLVHI